MYEVIAEGIKQFGGEIIGGILFAVALWLFPGLKKLFGKKDESGEVIQKVLDVHRQEEERLKEELKHRDEALREAEAQKAEESRRRAKIERQLEEQRREVKTQSNDEPEDAQAQYELGLKYDDANDYEKAAYWYRNAAEQCHAPAQYNLGYMYENGQGVAKDLYEARKWYEKAAAQGHQQANSALERLK